jgi:hypothetical protein
MTVKQLMNILSYHEDSDEVTINNNHIKVVGKFRTGESYEEFINSAGGIWEGGCGTDPEGKFCGECSTFDCDKCDWREREKV